MQFRNLHLFFHPIPKKPDSYRLECLGAIQEINIKENAHTLTNVSVTVGLSPRLKAAVNEYNDLLEKCSQKGIEKSDEDLLNLLNAWIGRLLWDNLFAGSDGKPNDVGKALLSSISICQSHNYIIRVLLHLGRMEQDSILMRCPWPSILYRRGEEGEEYKSVLAQEDNVNLCYFWPSSSSLEVPSRVRKEIRILLTYGDSSVISVFNDIRDDIRKDIQRSINPPIKLLDSPWSFPKDGNGSFTPEADLWIHVGHGEFDREDNTTKLLVTDPETGVRENLGTYDIFHYNVRTPIVVLVSCYAAAPGPNAGVSMARALLENRNRTHVIGFRVPIEGILGVKFINKILERLKIGDDIETAVKSFYQDRGLFERKEVEIKNVPIFWRSSLPIINTQSEEPPMEFDILDSSFDEHINNIFNAAKGIAEKHATSEDISVPSKHFIEPTAEHGRPALRRVEDLLGMIDGNGSDVAAHPLFLIGNTGLGKTFLLHHFFHNLVPETVKYIKTDLPILPVIIPLNQLEDHRKSMEGINADRVFAVLSSMLGLVKNKSETRGEESRKQEIQRTGEMILEKLVSKGRVLLMLDGLDELGVSNNPMGLRNWYSFLEPLFASPLSRVIISCRRELYLIMPIKELFVKSEELDLRPWADQDIKHYLTGIAKEFDLSLDNVNLLIDWGKEILSTPLFANFASRALLEMEESGEWSPTQTMKYITEKWSKRESRRVPVENPFVPQYLTELACHAAHKLASEYFISANIIALVDAVNKSLRTNYPDSELDIKKDILRILSLHSLLFVEHGQARFAHWLFQSYFSAFYVARNLRTTDNLDDLMTYVQYESGRFIQFTQEFISFLSDLLVCLPGDRNWPDELKERLQKLTKKPDESADAEIDQVGGPQINSNLSKLCSELVIPICSRIEEIYPSQRRIDGKKFRFGKLSFYGIEYMGKRISNIEFDDCIFEDTHFSMCEFVNCSFTDCEISKCTFEDSKGLKSEDLSENNNKIDEDSQASYHRIFL